MTLLQIAFKNISRDKHTYFSYFISSTVTILLFYLFTAAAMHPNLNKIQDGSTLALALGAGNFIIYVFAFLFIGYSSWAFLGSRGRQLGIYTILGMSPKQMKKMLENPSRFLATIQIGITLAGFLSSAFASETFASKLSPILNELLPVLSLQTWQAIDVTKNDPGNGVQSTDLSISLGLLFNSPENGAGRDLIIS